MSSIPLLQRSTCKKCQGQVLLYTSGGGSSTVILKLAEAIADLDGTTFLESQTDRWQCPECGTNQRKEERNNEWQYFPIQHFESLYEHEKKGENMIGKPVAVIAVPNQRLFNFGVAVKYLGKSPDTLRKMVDLGLKMVDLGLIEAKCERDSAGRAHRTFTLEDLDAYIDSLPSWNDSPTGERPRGRIE